MNFYANILESKQPVIGDDYFLQTKEEIIEWLERYYIKNYTINDDLTIDVIKDGVSLFNKHLTEIPVKFRFVMRDFSCQNNKLVSLKGTPDIVGGSFDCSFNKLESLEYCPDFVTMNFHCNNNELKSLKYCTKKINFGFDCSTNNLTSLNDLPEIDGTVYIAENPIKTLKGLKNISKNILLALISSFYNLDWKDIEWDKVKNIDEITTELYESIEKGKNFQQCKEALERLEELQLY